MTIKANDARYCSSFRPAGEPGQPGRLSAPGLAVLLAAGLSAAPSAVAQMPSAVSQLESRSVDRVESGVSADPIITQEMTPKNMPPAAPKTFFVLRQLTVDGSTALTKEEIAKLTAPYIGKRMSLAAFLAIGAKFKKAYNDGGYVVPEVVAPRQRITNGAAKLQVKEFAVDQVKFLVDGRPGAPPADMQALANLVTQTRPLTRKLYNQVIEDMFSDRPDVYVVDANVTTTADGVRVAQVDLTRDRARRPPAGSIVINPRLDLSAPPRNAADLRFRLNQVVVTGVTAYPPSSVQAMFQGLLGREIALTELFTVTSALQQRYNADDYTKVVVSVPPQIITDGVVKVKVKEYSVNKVVITLNGQEAGSRSMVQRIANQVTRARPLRNSDIARYAQLMGDVPGVKIGPRTEPEGPDGPIHVAAERPKYSGFFTLDNRGSQPVGPLQAELSGSAYSLFGLDDKLTVSARTSDINQEAVIYKLKEEAVLNPEGLKLFFNASYTNIKPKAQQEFYYLSTLGNKVNLRLQYPFIRGFELNWYGYGQFAWADETTTGFGGTQRQADDHLRILRFGSILEFNDRLLGKNKFTLEFSQGLSGLGASVSPEYTSGYRAGLFPDFSKITLDISRDQPLGDAFALSLGISAQDGLTEIPSAELSAYGGADYGRGFFGSVIYGDSGVMGKAELTYTVPFSGFILNGLQPYVYYDIGRTWIRNVPPATSNVMNGASFGGGLRANLLNHVSGELSYNQALYPAYFNSAGLLTKAALVLFSIRVDF